MFQRKKKEAGRKEAIQAKILPDGHLKKTFAFQWRFLISVYFLNIFKPTKKAVLMSANKNKSLSLLKGSFISSIYKSLVNI